MILIALLSALISSAFGQSRYILANYTLPDFEGNPQDGDLVNNLTPFPIGACVIYKAELDFLGFFSGNLIVEHYGKFECTTTSTTDDTVQFTDYGDDSTCMTQKDNTNDYTYYPKAASGSEGDFSCSGSDDYVSVQAWVVNEIIEGQDDGKAACCDGYTLGKGVVTSTFATGVCFDSGNGYYSKGGCNATQTTAAVFSDSDCTQETTPAADESSFSIGLIDATSDYCKLLGSDGSTFDLSLYGIMSECVIDGNAQSFDDYCPYVAPPTANPTPEPTEVTDDPTPMPTKNPTPPTPAPVEASANVSYFIKSLIVMVIGITIYMN